MLAMGWSSSPCSWLSRFRSHSSSFTSSEKLSSTAPARVPVTRRGLAVPEDQAKAAVRGISLNRTIFAQLCTETVGWCKQDGCPLTEARTSCSLL